MFGFVDCFVDYFDNRRNYKFVDACKCYKECITCNDIFYPLEACSIKLDEMQNFINGDNKGNYDYTKDVYPITSSKYYVRSEQPLNLNYDEYYSFGEDHIYITDKVELKDLEDALKDTPATYFKVRS